MRILSWPASRSAPPRTSEESRMVIATMCSRRRGGSRLARTARLGKAGMAPSEEEPVMLPFPDKEGAGWHVVIRYHAGHERRIDGFTTEAEALDWIVANSKQLDQ